MMTQAKKVVEQVLGEIIDEWYERVSGYYVTAEDLEEADRSDEGAELKRFHDPKGHRIKFDKDDLDFTYGLSVKTAGSQLKIEISVNNKVEHFNYEHFREELFAYYRTEGVKPVTKPRDLGRPLYKDVFQLQERLAEAFHVERQEGRADIMRLTFSIAKDHLDVLSGRPQATKELIESYCVVPFRSVYARVYRGTTTR